jgi:uncharacterized protein (TIGR00730 family)
MVKRICVFCGSNPGVRDEYSKAARALAEHLVEEKLGIIYGGSKVGLMGVLAEAALEAGGEIIGILPESLVAKEIAHNGLTDLKIVATMHERKALMAEMSDAFIAMPGGYGTYEEFCEVLTWTQLGLQNKPCGLLNVAGFYDCLLRMFDHAVIEGFVREAHRDIVISDANPASLVKRLRECKLPALEKWMDLKQT